MVKIEALDIGDTKAQGILIESPGGKEHPNMILIQCKNGFLMCGYLNPKVAEKFGDAAVIVSGADFSAVLENPVKSVTQAAFALGIREGMSGREALTLLNK